METVPSGRGGEADRPGARRGRPSRETAHGKQLVLIPAAGKPAGGQPPPPRARDTVCAGPDHSSLPWRSVWEGAPRRTEAPPKPLRWVTWSELLHFSEPWISHLYWGKYSCPSNLSEVL